jgi:hypothetical protein
METLIPPEFCKGSLAAQVASQSTDSSVRRIAELPWLLIVGESISEFGQERTITISSVFTPTPIIHLPIQLLGPAPVNEKCIRPLLLGTLAGFSGMAAKLGAAGLTSLVPWLTAEARLFLLFHTLL